MKTKTVNYAKVEICKNCKGTGKVYDDTKNRAFATWLYSPWFTCESCNGSGKQLSNVKVLWLETL